MSGAEEALALIEQEWGRLDQEWQRVLPQWQDEVQRGFERDYWRPLETETRSYLGDLQQLSETLSRARQSVQ